jgi:hypothetical protein
MFIMKKKLLNKLHKSLPIKILVLSIPTVVSVIFGFPGLLAYLESREPVDITGDWQFTFDVANSSYIPYIGNSYSYKIFITQRNQEFTGKGETWEFSSPLDFESHIPIEFEGKVSGQFVMANYTLYGKS